MILLVALFAVGTVVGSPPCPTNWTLFGQTCYWYSGDVAKSWKNAQAYCNSIGGQLGATYNATMLQFAESNVMDNSPYTTWSGLYYDSNLTAWRFVDKTFTTYIGSLWAPDEPVVTNGACGAIRSIQNGDNNGYLAQNCQKVQPFLCSQKTSTCDTKYLNSTSGTFTSPNYPFDYANNEYCITYITGLPGNFITLTFDAWIVEQAYDVVLIYDGFYPGPDASLIANVSSDPTTNSSVFKNYFQTQTNIMTVIFTTDFLITKKGWSASYKQYVYAPPIYQTGSSGQLTSMNYPSNYPNNLEQYSYVTVGLGEQIVAVFTDFRTEGNYRDFLIIYDGPNNTSPVLGQYTGTISLPSPVQTSGNALTLYFESDYSINYQGYAISWTVM